MIPTPKGFLGSGQPTGLPPKPDLSRYTEPSRYRIEKITPTREPQALPVEEPAPRIRRPYRAPPKPAPLQPRSAPVQEGTTRAAVLEVLHEQQEPITTEALALECWQRWPKWFGMKSRPDLPCTNAVYAKLAALTTDGYIVRPSVGMVRITAEGACVHTRGRLR